ncbi:serine hydroxymethyltransferase [Acetilactobacillus jinshanensis]|uniref:Serine hydroxymethyltransferase n=1 Tax=Acetilactobacillus jinshanensis TaxID=1720083 RepID=A0A4P6ZMS1_9LACO|nr:serine hydroxymethyltransferase [Acetilactobacillus jinshanensis]QBP18530.1 serine hydroxymethyltransferase [Acetilactobacillus jinshanensis]URL61403.1 serine hydroxymethyltransferase [uncultured bacterium]
MRYDYKKADPKLWGAIANEEKRQQNTIELIASENIVSNAVRAAQGSVLTNKYAEGYPGHRYYGGCQYIDQVEQLAIDRAKKLFHAEYANVQPYSGTEANLETYAAFLKRGDGILSMSLNAGGHISHGAPFSQAGHLYDVHFYGLDPKTERINYDQVAKLAKKYQPKLIIAGASAYSRIIDWKKFRKIADAVGAYLMVDMAHIAGLVATGLHPSPIGIADVVTTTTHKTLRGPRGGMILSQAKYAKRINHAVFPRYQGGPLEHVIAGKAAMLYEDLQPEYKQYCKQIIKNAQAMAEVFNNDSQVRVISGGTDNHLMILDLRKTNLTGNDLQNKLDSVNITTNKEVIPNDPRGPVETSGLRLGTPAITSRGFKEADAAEVAKLILTVIHHFNDASALSNVKKQVHQLTSQHPIHD